MMNIFNLLFKDFVVLKPNTKIPQGGVSPYGNYLIAKDIEKETDVAGLLNDNIILIDIDNEAEAQCLLNLVKGEKLKTVVIKTDRGYHFYFKCTEKINNRTRIINALGLEFDIRCANGNKSVIAIIKRNGTFRQIIYGAEFTKLDYYPNYLREVSIKDRTRLRPMYELGDGDGRNDYLHQYWKWVLYGNHYSNSVTRNFLRLINNYVLREPFDEKELYTIARDEKTNDENYSGENKENNRQDNGESGEKEEKRSKKEERKYICKKIAKRLVDRLNIVRLEGEKDDLLYFYEDNHYQLLINDSVICNLILNEAEALGELLSKTEIDTVLIYIKSITDRFLKEDLAHQKEKYLATNNKLIVFDKNRNIRIEEPTPAVFCTCKINVNYNENAKSEQLEKFFKLIANDNEKTEQLLKEVIGYCLYPKNIYRKSFFLIGNGGNGKSTYLNLLSYFLGYANTSNISLFDIENNRFATANLKDKLVNLGDDINADDFEKLSNFKIITSGDTLSAEFKGGMAFSFQPFCKLIYTANVFPNLRENSEGVKSRAIFVPFNKKFIKDGKSEDVDFIAKLTTKENMEALLQISLDALKTLFNRGYFEISEEVQKTTDEALKEADPIYSFLVDREEQNLTIYNEKLTKVYSAFKVYCAQNGIKDKITKNKFSKEVRNLYPNLTTKIIGVGKMQDGKYRTARVFYGTTDEEFSLVEKEDKEAEEMEKREEQPTTQDLINKAQEQPRPRKVLRVYNAKNNTYEYKDQTSNIFREEIQLFDDEDFSKYFREKTEETIFNLTQNDNFLTFEDFSHNLQIVIDLSKKNDEQAKEMLKAFL